MIKPNLPSEYDDLKMDISDPSSTPGCSTGNGHSRGGRQTGAFCVTLTDQLFRCTIEKMKISSKNQARTSFIGAILLPLELTQHQ